MKQKVAFYLVSTHLGGAERSLLEILTFLKKSERFSDVLVIAPKDDGPLLVELEKRGIPTLIHPMPEAFLSASRAKWLNSAIKGLMRTPAAVSYVSGLVRLLKKNDVALLHTTGIKCHFLGALAGRLAGIPVLWHFRDIFQPGPTRDILKFAQNALRPVTAYASNAIAESFGGRHYGTILYDGIDIEKFHPHRDRSFVSRFNIKPETPIVGICGVIARWKGQLQFVQMARKVLDAGIDARFLIVGDAIYDTSGEPEARKEVEALVGELKLEDRVFITGFQKDMPPVYSSLDVLVHASNRPEPFGLVVVEAMASGVPVVASKAGGVPEIVRSEKEGVLVTPGDVAGMANAVTRILRDSGVAAALSKNGRARAVSAFSRDLFENSFIQCLERIVGYTP